MSFDDNLSLGMLETTGFTPAIAALDVMEKTAGIRIYQLEVNDFLGVIIKIVGDVQSVKIAIEQGFQIANRLNGKPVTDIIAKPNEIAWSAIDSPEEYNPLIQQLVVATPDFENPSSIKVHTHGENNMSNGESPFALGFIETQGFTAVFEAIDTACKAANVEVVGKEKLGGGYVTVIIRGDVAAVKAAIDSGSAKVQGLGNLIAAHVISRPSESVLALLPKVQV